MAAPSTPWVLASAADDVKIWRNVPGGEEAHQPQLVRQRGPHAVRCVRFDNTGTLLGSCGDDGCVHISPVGGQPGGAAVTLQPEDSLAAATCFSFSSGSGYLSSGSADGVIRVWDTKQRRVLQRFDDHRGRGVNCMSFSSNDAHIASGNAAGDVLIHGLVTQRLAASLPAQPSRAPQNAVNHLEYSRLRKSLLGTATSDGSVYIWDVNATEKPSIAFPNQHKAACTGVAFSPVNHVLFASASMDGDIVFYDVAQHKIVKVMPTAAPITSMCFHDDGVTVAVGKANGDVAVYDLRSAKGNKPLVTLPQAHDNALAPNGVRSVHFQRTRREKSSRSKRDGSSPRSTSGLSESGTSVASSTATRERDLEIRSMRSSVASEASSVASAAAAYTEQPPQPPPPASGAVAPPAVTTPQTSPVSSPLRTPHDAGVALANPQSAARAQKTEAFQAKTNALLAKLDQMSPAPALQAAQEPEPDAGGASSSAAVALAPGLAQLRTMQKNQEAQDRAALAAATSVREEAAGGLDRAAARMSPPMAAAPPSATVARSEPGPMFSPVTSRPAAAGRLTTAWGSEHSQAAGAAAAPTPPRQPAVVDPPAVAVVTPQPQPQPPAAVPAATPQPAQMDMELLKGALDESMDILRASVHDEMQNIHLELVRQFHIQEHGFAAMLQQLDLRFER